MSAAADHSLAKPAAGKHACPVCGHCGLSSPPYERFPAPPYPDFGPGPYAARFGAPTFEGCDGCGYEFGYDDDPAASGAATSFAAYRQAWLAAGGRWFSTSRPPPAAWDPRAQLRAAGIATPR